MRVGGGVARTQFQFHAKKDCSLAHSLGAVVAADFIPPLARPEVTAKRKPAGGEARKDGRKG